MSNYRELMIGCGSRWVKDRRLPSASLILTRQHSANEYDFKNLVTLDINPDHKPDILFNLERIDGAGHNRIPFPVNTEDFAPTPDNFYDEIHAYEVLEHIGRQGDYRKFFDQFAEFWRILRPGGFLFATVPLWSSEWAWGDPSHTRIITPGTLVFLSQRQYREQVGKTPMSDFRWCYKADFETVYCREVEGATCFVLQAVK